MTNNTCFSAVDATVALNYKFSPPYDGRMVGIRLVHNSGGITCSTGYQITNWGCEASTGFFQTVLLQLNSSDLTSGDGILIYPTNSTDDVTSVTAMTVDCGCNVVLYEMNSYTPNSDEIILSSETSHNVSTEDEFILANCEAPCSYTISNNDGTSCAAVYFLYWDIFPSNAPS